MTGAPSAHSEIAAAAPAAEWARFLRLHPQVAALDAFVIDVNGNTLGKRVPAADAAAVYADGVQFSASALFADCRGLGHNVQGMGGSDGDPDGVALPIAGSLCLAPWTHSPTAQVLCEMRDIESRRPLWFDPRRVLAEVVRGCRDAGIHPLLACELEFYLIDPRRGADGRIALAASSAKAAAPRRAANLSMDAVEANAAFLDKVNHAAAAQGVALCGAVAEYGIGQFEINLRHVADPLRAADHAVLLKRIVKGVAMSMGLQATFMAKPFADQPGSGLHVHVSIVDEQGENRFGAAGGERLLQQAVAGMQALMDDSLGICAPNFNSHRRFLGPFVPRSRDWGYNNRSVAFRVPASAAAARRIEHRVAGADASPHLVLAVVLAAILHGIGRELSPTAPAAGRVGGDVEAGQTRGLSAALERTAKSAELAQYLPQRFLELFCELKRKECAALMQEILPAEHDFYL
ncbi:MAG TPA: glutamine synthetase family protein [Steroidobacteraceae bacterium]|nr:glutamine synthetase family protein [Steroidobacteraceae bacterium]